jgi:hypothetical protein
VAPLLGRANRPGGGNLEAGLDEGGEHRLPAGGAVNPLGVPVAAFFFVGAALLVVLLEGVIDREGKARVHLLPQHGEGPPEARLEVLLGLALVAVEALGAATSSGSLRTRIVPSRSGWTLSY